MSYNRQLLARAMSSRERALREVPSQYAGGAVAWSNENFIAVGQERSACVVVRPSLVPLENSNLVPQENSNLVLTSS